MLLIIMIVFGVIGLVLMCYGFEEIDEKFLAIGFLFIVFAIAILIYGGFTGFIERPATHGTHYGTLTAVDLEGTFFRRYEIYIKSGEYSQESDESKYCLYTDEKELIEKLNEYIGKTVKLSYGHNGGRIAWNSCGTYHITGVELVEE